MYIQPPDHYSSLPIDCIKDMVQMYILTNKKEKAILSFYSSHTHHLRINDFLIGVNAFEKNIYSTYHYRDRWVRKKKREGGEKEKERKQ
jgi:hypothetical protein